MFSLMARCDRAQDRPKQFFHFFPSVRLTTPVLSLGSYDDY